MITHARRVTRWVIDERTRIVRYLISGFSAAGVDGIVYLALTRFFHVQSFNANFFSVLAGASCAFVANKFWSFQTRVNTATQGRRFVTLFIFNYCFQQAGFFVAVHYLRLYDLAAKVLIIGIMVCWNFLLYKYWVYAVER